MYNDDRGHKAYLEILDKEDSKLQQKRTEQKFAMQSWVQTLKPWEVFATFTWEDWRPQDCRGTSMDSGRRTFERFMRKELPSCSYFYVLEDNTGDRAGLGCHVHALLADTVGVQRKEVWAKWWDRFGFSRIEPIKCQEDVANYCAKYVCKEAAWWNFKVLPDTLRAQRA